MSAWHFIVDDGCEINLNRMSPKFVADVVNDSVARWRWRRIEQKFPALDSQGMGLGACWRPVLAVLRMKDSSDWGPQHKGAIKSLLAGRQWPQQRLHAAKLVDSSHCQLCKDHVDGPCSGTLMHRLECPICRRIERGGGFLVRRVAHVVGRACHQ